MVDGTGIGGRRDVSRFQRRMKRDSEAVGQAFNSDGVGSRARRETFDLINAATHAGIPDISIIVDNSWYGTLKKYNDIRKQQETQPISDDNNNVTFSNLRVRT